MVSEHRVSSRKIGVSEHRAVTVQTYGLNTEHLVDTGAAVTIISSALFSMIPAEKRPQLKSPHERVKLETANNELIEVDGIATMDISIGEQQFQWDAFVAPINDEGILGYDFLYFVDCILEARRGIRIAGIWVQWTIEGSPPCVMPISLKENTTVQACSEWIARKYIEKNRGGYQV